MFEENIDYSTKNVIIGLSGGINSMAVLCWLSKLHTNKKPKNLYLYYAHFIEHSSDTELFVLSGVEYAKKHFENVIYHQENNSIIEYFKKMKFIPHPIISPCSMDLKIKPIQKYIKENDIDIDLIGYVKEEQKRIKRMFAKNPMTKITKQFPISNQPNEWCFEYVRKEIGWIPKIYEIKDEKGNRIFAHNNCLPCKNMQMTDFEKVKKYFPEYWERAIALSNELKLHWGREKEEFIEIYTTFGREDWETGGKTQSCEHCLFD